MATQTLTSLLALPSQLNFGRVERIALADQQRIERDAASDGAERGAVLRRDAIEPVGEPQAAGALHVARYQVGLPGMCLPMWRPMTRA